MAVDFPKAFDTVNHTTLLTDIHHQIRRLITYLRGRTAICRYNNSLCVLSPVPFNLHVSKFPQSSYTLTTSYADDTTVLASAVTLSDATATLSAHAKEVEQLGSDKDLQISAHYSTATLFTSPTWEVKKPPTNFFNNATIPLDEHPNSLEWLSTQH